MVLLYYNLMGPLSYVQFVVDQNVTRHTITLLFFFFTTVIHKHSCPIRMLLCGCLRRREYMNVNLNMFGCVHMYIPLMCAPGLIHFPFKMGEEANVAVTMTSASFTHSSALWYATAYFPFAVSSLLNVCAPSYLWFHIRIWKYELNLFIVNLQYISVDTTILWYIYLISI